jgi:DNA (cytosine-5)-methyltransferase 1
MFDRWITVREALRLMSFHDGFVPVTSEWQQLKQVGNAVPPLLGRVPALAAHTALRVERGEEIDASLLSPSEKQVSLF